MTRSTVKLQCKDHPLLWSMQESQCSSNEKIRFLNYHPRLQIGNNFSQVSVSVSVQAITFEPLRSNTNTKVLYLTYSLLQNAFTPKLT